MRLVISKVDADYNSNINEELKFHYGISAGLQNKNNYLNVL